MANLLLVSLDTLRADRLGSYGYGKPTSPYFDHVASQGARFDRAYATDIPTEVAHTGLGDWPMWRENRRLKNAGS